MQCHFCPAEATHFCDFVTSWQPYCTCDRPLCEEHALYQYTTFFCGEDGVAVSTDYCPPHARTGLHGVPGRGICGGGRSA